MAFTSITKPTQGTATKKSQIDTVIDNLAFLYSRVAPLADALVSNGSFELDSDADGYPDDWDVTEYTGGTFTHDTTTQANGAKCVKFTRASGAGNGGGYIQSDYINVSYLQGMRLSWWHKSSVAGLKNKVEFFWYTAAKAAASTASSEVYNSTSNPTAWEAQQGYAVPPSDARFAKVRLTGGYTDTDVAGDAYFDSVKLDYIAFPRKITFTATGNSNAFQWSPPEDCIARITIIGGGGGGGASGASIKGNGGGAGGQCVDIIELDSATTYSVIVGTGGSGVLDSAGNSGLYSSFTGSGTAGGGSGGAKGGAGSGGAGGTASGAMLNITGGAGADGDATNSGRGGHTTISGGGGARDASTVTAQAAGCEYGGGGAGVLGANTGGSGAPGVVIIE